jgi:hypothetical protein
MRDRSRSLAMRGRGFGGAPAFAPSSVTGYVGTPFSVAALRAAGNLWQDTAQTTPAVADTDPVRRAVCDGVNWDAPSDAARPIRYDEGGGKWSLAFAGSANQELRASGFTGNPRYLITRIVRTTTADGRALGVFTGNADDNQSYIGFGDTTTCYFSFGSTVRQGPITSPVGLDSYRTVEIQGSASAWSAWADGTAFGAQGSNTLPTWAATVRFGDHAGAEGLTGRVAGFLMSNGDVTAGEIAALRAYFGALA